MVDAELHWARAQPARWCMVPGRRPLLRIPLSRRSVLAMSKPQMPAWDDVRVAQPGRRSTVDEARPGDMERIRAAIQAAQETFEDAATAAEWLESPCLALGGVIPLQTLGTEEGLDQVLRELVRICHGIPP